MYRSFFPVCFSLAIHPTPSHTGTSRCDWLTATNLQHPLATASAHGPVLSPPDCSHIRCTNLCRNRYSPDSSCCTIVPNTHLFPCWSHYLATNLLQSLKYSPLFHFLSYAPREQQAPPAWNRWEFWSVVHGPLLTLWRGGFIPVVKSLSQSSAASPVPW